MTTVAILYGGKSGEHEVSLVSAASILSHIDRARYDAIPIGIAKNGVWYLQEELQGYLRGTAAGAALSAAPVDPAPSMRPLPPVKPGRRVIAAPGAGLLAETAPGSGRFEPMACDAVFPVLHGTFGEDGTVQGLLETADLPYAGAGVLGSALGMDKEKAKELWKSAGLPVVDFITVRRADLTPERLAHIARKIEARFGWPAFAKPACAGSSVGASKIADASGLEKALREALEWDEKALIEPFVDAREIECAVLGNEDPRAFTPGEIAPTHEFYDYEAKYKDPDGARLLVPAPLGAATETRVREIAVAAYRACEMSGMARIDFFLERRTGELYLNEANTIPGFTGISMYPRMCAAGGLAYPDLIDELITLALRRHRARASIRYDFA